MANNTPQAIRQDQIEALIAAGSVRSVTIEPAGDEGWAVRLRLGIAGDAVIASRHRPVRTWRHLDTLAAWLRARGLGHAEIRLAP